MGKLPSLMIAKFVAACFVMTQAISPVQAHPVVVSHTAPVLLPNTALNPAGSASFLQTFAVPITIQHSVVTHSPNLNSFNQPKIIYYVTTQTTNTTTTTTTSTDQPGTVSVTVVPGSSTAASQQILAVLTGDWAAWTGGSTKNLTIAEVASLLANSKVTGSQAAVLGMLADQMYSDAGSNSRLSPSYTLAQAEAYVLGTATSSNALFTGAGTSYYTSVMSQVASSTNANGTFSLYGSSTGPQLFSIQQGALGDCFFLSAVNSVLNQNPKLIANMVTSGSNGTFSVAFPNGQSEKVTLTDGEIAAFSQAQSNGAWLAVFGMAENEVLAGSSAGTSGVPTALVKVPLGIISDGGYPTQSLGLLTGQTYSNVGSGNLERYTTTSIDALLTKDLATNIPINVESEDHALSIIGFNAQTQTVTILNPWGVSGTYGYSDDPGVMNSNMEVQMTNGVFQLSTSALLADFYSLTVQSSLASLATLSRGGGGGGGGGGFWGFGLMNGGAVGVNAIASGAPTTMALQSSTSSPQLVLPVASLSLLDSTLAQSNVTVSTLTSPLALGAMQTTSSAESHELSTSSSDKGLHAVSSETAYVASPGEIPVYEASQGSMLIINDNAVEVRTSRASVQVAPHAAALIVQLGDEVAVSNLCDKRLGEVAVSVGGTRVDIPMGKTILLGASSITDAKLIRLADSVDGRQAAVVGKFADTNAFMGNASYIWALKACPQFRRLVNSTDETQRLAAMKVMKAAAAVMMLAQGQ